MTAKAKKKLSVWVTLALILIIAVTGILSFPTLWTELTFYRQEHTETELKVKAYAEEMGIFYRKYPKSLIELLDSVVWRAEGSDSVAYQTSLDELRGVIDRLDNEILKLLSKRMEAAEHIGRIKRENNVMILQPNRWNQIVDSALSRADELGLSPEFLKIILEAIHIESIERQRL